MWRRLLREALAFGLFLLLALSITWPLATHLSTSVPDRGDPLLNAWILDWVCHALATNPAELFNAPMYYPAPRMLAFSENLIGIGLVVLPFHLAGLPPLTVYNLALLLGFAFAGYGAFVLARMVTGETVPALIAGTIHAFLSFKVAHVQHLQIVWSGWLPLLLAALLLFWRTGRKRHAMLLAGAFLMNGLTNIHWLLFGGVTLLLTIAFLQFAEPRPVPRFWLTLCAALALASVLLLPVLLPYRTVAQEYGARRTTGEAREGSATPKSWLTPSSRNVLYGRLVPQSWHLDERELFPGVLALVLGAVAIGRARTAPRGVAVPMPWRALDAAIAILAIATVLVAVSGRIRLGSLSFAGADVPAMLTAILVIVRLGPWLKSRLATSRFTTPEWSGAIWIVAGVLGSLGWNFFFHPFLFRVVAPFRATRTPARWAAIACVGIALWAAIGAAELLRRNRGRWRPAVAGLLLGAAVLDVAARLPMVQIDWPPAPVYRWLAKVRPPAIVELPLVAEGVPFIYLTASTSHRVPLVNGTSGFETPLHERLRLMEENGAFGDAFLQAIAETGATMIVVHEERLSAEQRQALSPLLSRLPLLAAFGRDRAYGVQRSVPRPSP